MNKDNLYPWIKPWVKDKGDAIIISGVSSDNKRLLYEMFSKEVVHLSRVEYTQRFPNSVGAHFEVQVEEVIVGMRIINPRIYINIDDFEIDGEDFTDLIPITVRHEVAEMYLYAKDGYKLPYDKWSPVAHGVALREEYRYACMLGKATRYFNFCQEMIKRSHISQDKKLIALDENRIAYELIVRRSIRKHSAPLQQ